MKNARRVWKVRIVKEYPEAHNHLIVGEVVEEGPVWVKLRCRTYHFGRSVERPQDVKVGILSTRIIPWARVEIINELPEDFDYAGAKLVADGKGNVSLVHGRYPCPIVTNDKNAR
jgi:hypothetical protein